MPAAPIGKLRALGVGSSSTRKTGGSSKRRRSTSTAKRKSSKSRSSGKRGKMPAGLAAYWNRKRKRRK